MIDNSDDEVLSGKESNGVLLDLKVLVILYFGQFKQLFLLNSQIVTQVMIKTGDIKFIIHNS